MRTIVGGLLGAMAVGCAPPAPVSTTPPAAAPGARLRAETSGPARCPARVDPAFAKALLARHARAYGEPEAVAAMLPITLAATATASTRVGKLETSLTRDAHRTQLAMAGIVAASGIDAKGAWSVAPGTGLVERLTSPEAIDSAVDAWLLRRSYVREPLSGSESVRCEDLPTGGARVDVTYPRQEASPALGSPTLSFDLENAALLSMARTGADGKATSTTFEAWTAAENGVRWPRKSTEHPAEGSATSFEVTDVLRGLVCSRIDPSGVALPERGEPCAAPPPDRLLLRWPAPDALGRTLVRLPFTYLGGEILVRAKLGGRDVNAFLDSGASVTAVEASTPAGLAFRSSVEVEGIGSTQRIRVGFGELPAIDIGGLHAEHLPTASVPIPGLDAFGDKRPELLLGYAFFATTVVRVDYTRRELVFARSTDGIFAKGNEPRAVPLRVLDSKIVVEGEVEGTAAPFEVDTGNRGGLDLYKRWASAHGLPGTRPTTAMKGRFGAGPAETTSAFYRLAAAALGPIRFDGHLSHVDDPPGSGIIAGLAGNEVLARCDAVVFDVPRRTLWLEGSCAKPVPERKVGWRFEKKIDPGQPDLPWVVSALWTGGPAERAGVRVGDRVLELGGKRATADVAPLWAMEEQPAGTKLPVLLSRAGAVRGKDHERVVIELRTLAP